MFLFVFCALGISAVWAQKTFSGKVIGPDGLGLPGVNVVEKANPTNGTATDIDGNWTLTVPNGNSILEFSSIGMRTVELAAKDAKEITMQDDAQMLEDVVVIGYGSARKITNTSASVVKVGGKQLEDRPTANPFDAIQGKVTGLQVFSSSGEPSEVSSVRLHGTGSLGAGATPLYILDGIPVSSSTIQSMNSNDFESMQVLKDAAATSIYGARAANGVVFITTKKGKSGERANITVRGQYGVSNLANEDYFKSMMTADELGAFWLDAGMMTEESLKAKREKYPYDTRWYEYYFKDNVPTYQADVAISGGKGSTRYYVSGGVFDQEGLRYRSGYTKYNFRTNLSTSLNDYIKIGANTAIAYSEYQSNQYDRNSTNGGLSLLALPFYSPYDKNGNEYYGRKIPGWNRYSPRYLADKKPYPKNRINVVSSANVTVKPIENLTLRSQVGLEFTDYRGTWKRLPSYASALGNGGVYEKFNRKVNWTITNTAEYKFNVNEEHNFTALLGQEYIDYHYDGFGAEGFGLQDDRLTLLGNTTKDKKVGKLENNFVQFTEYAFLSYFTQLSYDYKEKYFVDVSLRQDESSRFGTNNKTAMFWSAGLLWKAKKESFLKDVDWLNDLNVKFSIGTSGNAAIGDYQSLALAGNINQYKTGTGWGITASGNPNLTWEQQTKTTFGFDARLFDRLGVNIEVYNRLTSDMLMSVPYPYTSGFSKIKDNVGEYQNRGIDLKLDYDFYKNDDGDYVKAYLNYNYNKDEVKSLFQGLDHWIIPNTGVCYVVGQPVMFFYPLFKQVNPENGAPEWYVPGEDITKTTKEESTDRFTDGLEQNTGVKRYAPVNGGWGLDASFKGFYLQSYFTFSYGKNLIVNDAFFFENPTQWGVGFNQRNTVRDFWKKPGDKAKFPSTSYRFTEFDSRMIQDASFMRLKTLTLGYQLPKNILGDQNLIQGAKIYFTGRNLFTWTGFEGPDPEIDSNLTLGANPNTKQISVGLEITF